MQPMPVYSDTPPTQSPPAKAEKPLTVREALEFKREVAGMDFRDLLMELFAWVPTLGGEEDPEWQRHKLRLKHFLRQLEENGMLSEDDVETIFADLTA